MKIRNALEEDIMVYIGFEKADEPEVWFEIKSFETLDLKEKDITPNDYDLIEIQKKK